jgi:hypothetical protein
LADTVSSHRNGDTNSAWSHATSVNVSAGTTSQLSSSYDPSPPVDPTAGTDPVVLGANLMESLELQLQRLHANVSGMRGDIIRAADATVTVPALPEAEALSAHTAPPAKPTIRQNSLAPSTGPPLPTQTQSKPKRSLTSKTRRSAKSRPPSRQRPQSAALTETSPVALPTPAMPSSTAGAAARATRASQQAQREIDRLRDRCGQLTRDNERLRRLIEARKMARPDAVDALAVTREKNKQLTASLARSEDLVDQQKALITQLRAQLEFKHPK